MSNKKTHTLQIIELKNPLKKAIGLIGEKKPQAILFMTRFGIHTFGVRFPIDVLILNKNKQIVKVKENLQPNRFFFWNPKYTIVLELPEGTIQKNKIEHNHIILYS
jgi:uncharacterized protein